MLEHELIERYFATLGAQRPDVVCGIGDDCAILQVPCGDQLAVSIDTLVAGAHFLADCPAEAVGHKALAVGLSDLAAMGAKPAWATLALTIPEPDPTWLAGFAQGLGQLAAAHGVAVVGGDTTRGPLAVSVQVHGLLPSGRAVRRSGARPGDRIYVSGTLGDAGLALRQLLSGTTATPELRRRLERPEPRVTVGQRLIGLATAMIDLSDGLAADLGHILSASGLGATLELAALPLDPAVAAAVQAGDDWELPLASGDDYELCFTVPAGRDMEVAEVSRAVGTRLTHIGEVTSEHDLRCRLPNGRLWSVARGGYDHFSS